MTRPVRWLVPLLLCLCVCGAARAVEVKRIAITLDDLPVATSTPIDSSETRRAIAADVENFVDIALLSDAKAAEKMAADGVQILIDLAGHTTGGRLGILARRPAPVQAHYLGYAGTTGAAFIDYFISDPVATPVAMADQFTERLALVPGCFMMSAGVTNSVAQAPSRAAQGLPVRRAVAPAQHHPADGSTRVPVPAQERRAAEVHHELHLPGVRDRAGQPLVHDVAYYTLNQIPKN